MSVRLSRHPLSPSAAFGELEGRGVGGTVVFVGRVRPDRTRTGRVRALVYEVDRPVALARLRAIDRETRARFGALRTVLWHRTGTVAVDGIAVIVGAGCAHRDRAFAAARHLIEEVKASVPLWKEVRGRPLRPRRSRRALAAGRSAG